MLIDASHPEETRVLVVNKNKLEDFDVEVESRRPLKGNIYLAKVTRVEPSLQAAFVDFGGSRHGFLAFNEIHPDYYQIPVADRELLIAEARAEAEAARATEDDEAEPEEGEAVETLGGDDSEEIEARRPVKLRRNYKIQEVIKRRQILLIQVVKEERGTKGAALTTFLSLAGRYCVLMPNTDRGGGISRKIGSAVDRKRLKSIVNELGIPEGIAVIVRTAGAKRSKAEIRRDYDYLLRLWNQVREMTLNSIAPCLVHEEGNLIKRSIRDLYTKEIDEIIVHGEAGYRMAKDFMKILIPSHAKKVQKYKDEGVSMTNGYNIDDQLSTIHSPEVHMKSGAYIVINPTEALVSIDVNSGRSTKERNIEETALRTNIEAAEEIARQLRLRDLAGLIVIDFIDMEVHRNHGKVERALKEAMRPDRARIQIGRISPFGLLELSRQRLRPSLLETSSEPCPYCQGTGIRRSTDTTAVEVIRAIEEEGMRKPNGEITVYAPTSVALFILNKKRQSLVDIEEKYGLAVTFEGDDTLIPPAIRIEREDEGDVTNKAKSSDSRSGDSSDESGGKRRRRRRSRRRGRRDEAETITDGENGSAAPEDAVDEHSSAGEIDDTQQANGESDEKESNRRRRRGRRGGRRRRRHDEDNFETASSEVEAEATDQDLESAKPASSTETEYPDVATSSISDDNEMEEVSINEEISKEGKRRPQRSRQPIGDELSDDRSIEGEASAELNTTAEAPKPRRRRRKTGNTQDTTQTEKPKRRRRTNKTEAATHDGTEAPVDDRRVPDAADTESEKMVSDLANAPTAIDLGLTVSMEAEQAADAAQDWPGPDARTNNANGAQSTVIINVDEKQADNTNPRRGWWKKT